VPELPDICVYRECLERKLLGEQLVGLHIKSPFLLRSVEPAPAEIEGRELRAVRRLGKRLVFDFDGDYFAVLHLRMTGRLHMVDARSEPGPYERLRLILPRKQALSFVDVRKFGRFTYEAEPGRVLDRLGPEPLEDGFSSGWFRKALKKRQRALKPLLLDQAFLAGLGNIYVDESLFRAGLHPLRLAHKLTGKSADRLHGEIRRVLSEAIEREGSSFDTFYRTPEGQPGSYQHQFQVYGRDGKPCRACGATLRKFVVGQRGTHVCLRCQRPPRRGSGLP
ncbi:UNVERIFIED_CONTAM: hypothetical protein GTU68_054028, partial [Idotea baltica]|nr:hypothetical protein [Idotea baltica]